MKYSFNAFGHENILGTHQSTIEFTKDKYLSLKGDCIIGVKANYNLNQLKKIINRNKSIKKKSKIKIIIKAGDIQEEVIAEVNSDFHDDKDMVIRKSNFVDKRTFAINADKSAFELDRGLIDKLKDINIKLSVEFHSF